MQPEIVFLKKSTKSAVQKKKKKIFLQLHSATSILKGKNCKMEKKSSSQ